MTEISKKIKRKPVAVRMNTDIISMARLATKEEYGSSEKLGLWLEDAIQFYVAQKTDESRATALLQILEGSLFKRISTEIEAMHKAFTKRDNLLDKRLGNLMAISSYESCLSQLMLKESLYSKDVKSKTRYEELRSAAAREMKVAFDTDARPIIEEQQKEIKDLKAQYNKMRKAISSRDTTLSWLAKNIPSEKKEGFPNFFHSITEFPPLED